MKIGDTDLAQEFSAIERAASAEELDAIELRLLGRKQGILTHALRALGEISAEERKKRGQELNDWKMRLTQALTDRRSSMTSQSMSKLASTDCVDVTLNLPAKGRGHQHPIPAFIRSAEEVFGRMGFDTAHGNEVETEEYNFTLLNIPPDHPARDMQDTFWVVADEPSVLRTHTSPVQIRYMQSHTPPFRMVCAGKVYRKDSDATHSPMFHQLEGLMVGKDISLAHMKHVMTTAMHELLSPDIILRFRTSYFQFVEPALEVDIQWKAESGHAKEGKWLEVAGCGMVHPTVLRNGGIDADAWQGFSFGFGIERLLMIKHQIQDMRAFYEGDLAFLRQF